jgi:hypothetical protein
MYDRPCWPERRSDMTTNRIDHNEADPFGVCPICGNNDGYVNVGRNHWFFCAEHKTKWWGGSNLFSSWREQTEEEMRRIYEEVGLGEFKRVEPS